MTAQVTCFFCDCPTPGKHGRRTSAKAIQSCDPATCWQWDHTCYAKRMKAKGGRARAAARYAPATIRGVEVPQIRIAA